MNTTDPESSRQPDGLKETIIASIGTALPANRVSNDDLAKIVDTSDEWIYSKTGIRYRYIADDDQSTSDLAAAAGQVALQRAGLTAQDVDMLIVGTCSGDYHYIPSTACVVQQLIGADKAAAMDLTAACTGFIYGLETARAFVRSGQAANVLVIGAEVLSRIVDWSDRGSCVLFGDGAGAAVVTSAKPGQILDQRFPPCHIVDSVLRSKGKDFDALIRPRGGSRDPLKAGTTVETGMFLHMDGQRVYKFAVAAIGEIIKSLLNRNGLSMTDIDWVIPHQANARIIEAAAKRLKYPLEQMYSNIQDFANTSAASVPLAMNEMIEAGLLKPGHKVITVGFGAGLTYGGNLLQL